MLQLNHLGHRRDSSAIGNEEHVVAGWRDIGCLGRRDRDLVVNGRLEVQRYVALSLVLTVCCRTEPYQPNFGDRCSRTGFDLEILIIDKGSGRLGYRGPGGFLP